MAAHQGVLFGVKLVANAKKKFSHTFGFLDWPDESEGLKLHRICTFLFGLEATFLGCHSLSAPLRPLAALECAAWTFWKPFNDTAPLLLCKDQVTLLQPQPSRCLAVTVLKCFSFSKECLEFTRHILFVVNNSVYRQAINLKHEVYSRVLLYRKDVHYCSPSHHRNKWE